MKEHLIGPKGNQVRVFSEGNEQHPAVVLLHGYGLDAGVYKKAREHLSQSYHVLSVDLPGHGRSYTPKKQLDYGQYASHLVRVVDEFQLDPFYLVGHSMGGGVALTYASQAPARVKSLALLNSAGIPITLANMGAVRLGEVMKQAIQSRFSGANFRYISAFLKNMFKRPIHLHHGKSLPIYQDLTPILKSIRTPTLLLWGDRDAMMPLSMARQFQQGINNSKLIIIEGGGHEWPLLMPKRLCDELVIFWTSLEQA